MFKQSDVLDLGFKFSKTIELRVRDRDFRSSRPSMRLVFDALPFYSSKDFDMIDKFAALFKLDSIILRNCFSQLPSMRLASASPKLQPLVQLIDYLPALFPGHICTAAREFNALKV